MPWDVLEHDLDDQAGDGVQIAREGLAAEPQCLERDRTAAGEGIHHQRCLLRISRLHQRPAHSRYVRLAERSQFAKSAMNRSSALRRSSSVLPGWHPHRGQEPAGLRLELSRAERIARVRQEKPEEHRPTRRQRPPRPPEVEGAWVPVPDRLLPRRVPRHLRDRKIALRQAFAFFRDHVLPRLTSFRKHRIARRRLSARFAATSGRQCRLANSTIREV